MTTDVLIVGAGPTGLMLANQLGRRGIGATIIDRHSGPAQQTRAMAVGLSNVCFATADAYALPFAQAAFDGWHTWRTQTAPSRGQLLAQVATFQAPLRDLQIHGLALYMILAVSQHFFPPFLGIPATPRRRGWLGLGAIGAGLVPVI